jgi:hypothetical protein
MIRQSVSGLAARSCVFKIPITRASALLGTIHRGLQRLDDRPVFTGNTPQRVFALMSPHSANIDCAKVEQQCGGILAHVQPVYARGMEF